MPKSCIRNSSESFTRTRSIANYLIIGALDPRVMIKKAHIPVNEADWPRKEKMALLICFHM